MAVVTFFVACYNTNLELIWGTTAGGPGIDEGRDVAIDRDGNVYMTGIFTQTIEFNSADAEMHQSHCPIILNSNGATDVPVAMWNRNGELQEGFSIGGSGYDGGNAIKVDSIFNIYVGGFFQRHS